MIETQEESPKWSVATKALVALAVMLTVAGMLVRFQHVIPILVLAPILTIVIVPIVQFMCVRMKMPWGLAATIAMLIFILLLIGASTVMGFAIVQQLQALFLIVQRFLLGLPAQLENLSQHTYQLGPWVIEFSQFDLAAVGEQVIATIQPLLREVSSLITFLATGVIESLTRIILVLAITYFLIFDYRRIRAVLKNISIPGYKQDIQRLQRELLRIWQAFMRGQLLIVTITGFLTYLLMQILGVRFPIGLGVLGGIAKFIPIVGPVTAGFIAALVGLFQPSNWFGLVPLAYAAIVVICVVVLDQSIDIFLVPRIMGTTLNLHPAVILVGLVIGASLAGVIGLLLSAPTIASFLLIGRYLYRKMSDLSPWDPPIDVLAERTSKEAILPRIWRSIKARWNQGKNSQD
ncbi:MAG: AI-2E family transporter [Anaerolineales bacterium]|nr:AI-2E family transporter [Anaerolineales bacterium]